METLKDAVEAATQYAGGRPLKWEEWKQHLMQEGDALSSEEISSLEAVLAARGDQPSMKLFFDDYAEKLEQQAVCRAALAQQPLPALEDSPLVTSLYGVTILSPGGTAPLPGQHCTLFLLHLTEERQVRLRLEPRSPGRHMLLLLRRPDGSLAGVCSAVDGAAEMDRQLPAGSYRLAVLLLPDARGADAAEDTAARRQLFTVSASGEVRLTAAYVTHLRELFRLWDWNGSGGLSRAEFSAFNELTAGERVRDEEWAIVGANFETSPSGELTEAGFLRLHQLEAEDSASEPDELWLSLTALGFGPDLAPRRLAGYRLSVLCSDAAAVALTADGVAPLSRREVAPLLRQLALAGEPLSEPGWRRVALRHLVLLVCVNLSAAPLLPRVDTAGCTNCVALVSRPVAIPPGDCGLAQCLLRSDPDRPWTTEVLVSSAQVG